ncbi:hypothetical protein ACIBSV_42810 [Embleya sp. NPDC050154]|uniref:hypothetical protein n=1 Tax=unclassified Embleya TaxID=2699296 RepID=UPI0037A25EEB
MGAEQAIADLVTAAQKVTQETIDRLKESDDQVTVELGEAIDAVQGAGIGNVDDLLVGNSVNVQGRNETSKASRLP